MMRVKKEAIPIPNSEAEAIRAVADIGRLQRQIEHIEGRLNDRIDKVKLDALEMISDPKAELEVALDGLFAYCQANREELMPPGRKTISWPTGEISWRMTPPKVGIRDVKKVLAGLRQLGLSRFIRTKEEIDKEAILKDRDAVKPVKGIAITQCEEFVVKPSEVSCEITRTRKA